MNEFREQIIKCIKDNNYKLVADKIITILKSIKNDPNISSIRWVFELLQNATDVRNENERISVKIIITDDKLEFQHNGKFFYIQHLLGLVQQVSSKNSKNLEGQTGKFGTGFIGTHCLSDIIDVKGVLYVKENDFRDFYISLDRTEQCSENLAKEIEKSIEIFLKIDERPDIFKPRENYLQNRKESDYDTCFIYYLTDEEKKKAARDGINDLINTVPSTLITMHKKIKQITIVDEQNETETSYISEVKNENQNDVTESSVKINSTKKEKLEEETIHFFSYLKSNNEKEILRLILQVEKKNGKIFLMERDKTKPVLYRNFPLIGSNEFNMPFIVDGFDFNPLETRSGIFLNGGNNDNNLDTHENFDILEKAYDSSIEFIKCIINKYSNILEKRYILAANTFPKPIVNFDSFAENWFYKMQINYRNNLKDLILVEYGENKEKLSKLSELLLPVFNEKCDQDFYDLVLNLNIKKKIIPHPQYYNNWYNIIIGNNNHIQGLKINDNKYIQSWGMFKTEETGQDKIYYIYDEKDFLKDLCNCKNLKTLGEKVGLSENGVIEKLNDVIRFLKKKCNYEEILNKYPILPNRNGDFKKVKDLYSDDKNPIPLYIINICDSVLNIKLNEQLINKDIYFEYLGDIIKKKDFDLIIRELNSYIDKKEEDLEKRKKLAYSLLSIKSENKKISKIYEFLSLFHNKFKQTEIISKNKIIIPEYLWDEPIKFWYCEFPKEIESYENVDGFKNKLLRQNVDNTFILKWINTFLEFLKMNSSERNFEKLKIFPNQNGKFCALDTLYYDSGFPEEFKGILKDYFNIDKKEILLNKEITAYSSFNTIHESDITKEIEEEFNKLKTNEIQNREKLLKIAIEILCLYPTNTEKDTIKKYLEAIICPKRTPMQINNLEYLGFAEVVYNKKYSSKIKRIKTDNLKYLMFINYIIEKICDEISKAGNLENIKNKFNMIKTQDDLEKFLLKIIKFIWDNQNSESQISSCIDCGTSEKALFLNMHNQLLPLSKIRIKESDLNEENEEIIFKICNSEFIKEDPKNQLLNNYLYRNLSKYENKFRICKINELCSKIDEAIKKYDKENKKENKKYGNDFYKLLEDLKKLKMPQKTIEELFPYYSKNIANLTMNCFDKELVYDLLTNINSDNIKDQIQLLKNFQNKDSLNDINNHVAFYGKLHHCNHSFTINQKFMFKIKLLDENKNEKIIKCKEMKIAPEKFSIKGIKNYKYDNIIEFEIDSLDNTLKNNELKISYNKQ